MDIIYQNPKQYLHMGDTIQFSSIYIYTFPWVIATRYNAVSSRIWTGDTVSIFLDDNHCTTNAPYIYVCVCVCVCVLSELGGGKKEGLKTKERCRKTDKQLVGVFSTSSNDSPKIISSTPCKLQLFCLFIYFILFYLFIYLFYFILFYSFIYLFPMLAGVNRDWHSWWYE